MKAQFIFFAPGNGYREFFIERTIDISPRVGETVSFLDSESGGTSDYIVRRVRWEFITPCIDSDEPILMVECDYILTDTSSDKHREACARFTGQGATVKTLQSSR